MEVAVRRNGVCYLLWKSEQSIRVANNGEKWAVQINFIYVSSVNNVRKRWI